MLTRVAVIFAAITAYCVAFQYPWFVSVPLGVLAFEALFLAFFAGAGADE